MSKKIPILFEDDQLIAFNKPAGLLVIPAPSSKGETLTDIVNQQHAKQGSCRLHPCHRLDKGTSGAILYAKGKKYQQSMMELFHKSRVTKIYTAFVKGTINRKSGTLSTPVQDRYDKKFSEDQEGKLAVTHYEVIARRRGYTILTIRPQTGRTNQIRIHFAQSGHPLLGERIYAFRKDFSVNTKRLALHSSGLTFVHPFSGKRIRIEAPLAKDLAEFSGIS